MDRTPATRLRTNSPQITSERFDDEIVVVDFESGKYHSLQGTAVPAWELLEGGATEAEIVAALRARFADTTDAIAGAVGELLSQLVTEGVLVEDGSGPSPSGAGGAALPEHTGDLPDFTPPVLSTFSDMQDLLVLDPIHEVDDAGWPMPRPRDDS